MPFKSVNNYLYPAISTIIHAMKILIADDHELYREALSILVRRLADDIDVHLACNFTELLSLVKHQDGWDAILIDLNMPDLNFYDGISQVTKIHPDTPVIVVTSSEDPSDTQQALEAGALGYMTKSMKSDAMLNALKLMLDSGISIHPVAANDPQNIPLTEDALSQALTPRQFEVLQHMCEGSSNKRIALNLALSESTVKLHVRAILNALNVSNRTEAVIKAKELLSSADK